MENNSYNNLQSLSQSSYQVRDEEPNVIGWEVKNEAGAYVGEVADLLYDNQSMTVRYLVIDLLDNGMNLDDKTVMIPIGIANLHASDDEVLIPNIHIDQFNALPEYQPGQVSPETEQEIREVIGSPAALRIEETIAEFDQQQFYQHHHFNSQRFYQRGNNPNASTPSGQRVDEQQTIHQLIENSIEHDLQAATPETGSNTHHNEGKKIDEVQKDVDNNVTPYL